VAIARQSRLDEVCRRLMALLRHYRETHKCFSVITLYLKGIRSAYLSGGRADDERWAEVLFYVAIRPEHFDEPLLDRLVAEFDAICVDAEAYRYMHSRTTADPAVRQLIDPHNVQRQEESHGA
jgi:hypothetical protein